MYNSLSALPYIPYNILVYLARQDAAEDLWKLLKYNSHDALSKPNFMRLSVFDCVIFYSFSFFTFQRPGCNAQRKHWLCLPPR